MSNKRVLVVSDLHSGHVVGLTPPKFQQKPNGNHHWDKCVELQKELWKFYRDTVKSLGHIDILIANGDMIDGRGERSGGTELISSNRDIQVDIATCALQEAHADSIVMTYGTGYHVGDYEDFEDKVAKNVSAAKIGAHEWLDVNGLTFDCKHHIGSSSVPHGRHTATARERLWNLVWTEFEEQPKADVIIRSHVHYFDYCGEANWLAMTTPALQGMGSRYGSRRCSGHVDFGVVHFDVNSNGSYTWQAHIARVPGQKAQTLKF